MSTINWEAKNAANLAIDPVGLAVSGKVALGSNLALPDQFRTLY
ncbi:hypothetical protein ACYX78_05810 [Advenella incenata]